MRGLWLVVLAGALLVCPVSSQECARYSEFPGFLGGEPHGSGPVRGAGIAGDLAVISIVGGIATVDISDPTSPSRLAVLPLGVDPATVVLLGGVAYVAGRASGVHVVDVADPHAPVLVASVPARSDVTWLQFGAGLLCVSDGNWWRLLAMTDPLAPAVVAEADMGTNVRDATAADNRLVVISGPVGVAGLGTGRGSMHLYDIETPLEPVLLGSYEPDYINEYSYGYGTGYGGVAIVGGRAFCSYQTIERIGAWLYGQRYKQWNGICVFDLADPSDLTPWMGLPAGFPHRLGAANGQLAVAIEPRQIQVYDVTAPDLPRQATLATASSFISSQHNWQSQMVMTDGALIVGTLADGLQFLALPTRPEANHTGSPVLYHQQDTPVTTGLTRVGDHLYASWYASYYDTNFVEIQTADMTVHTATAPFTKLATVGWPSLIMRLPACLRPSAARC